MVDDPVCSRTSSSLMDGTLDDLIQAFRINSRTKAILRQRGGAVGLNVIEYVRMVLELHAHGEDEVRRVQAKRLAMVARTLGQQNGDENPVPNGENP